MKIPIRLHFYYCAYISIRLNEIYEGKGKLEDKTFHLIDWMNNASSNNIFGPQCDSEIKWLHRTIEKHGIHLDVERLTLHIYKTSISLLASVVK